MPQALFIGTVSVLTAIALAFVTIKGRMWVYCFVAFVIVMIVAYMMYGDEDFKAANVKEPDSDVLTKVKEKWADKEATER